MSLVLSVIKSNLFQINYRARVPMDDGDSTGHHPEFIDEAPATALPEILRRIYHTQDNNEIYQKILRNSNESFKEIEEILTEIGLEEGDLSYLDNGMSTIVLKIKNIPYVVKLSIAPRIHETPFASIACYQKFEHDRQYKVAIVPQFIHGSNAPADKRVSTNEQLFKLMSVDGIMPSDTHVRNVMFFAQEREVHKGHLWTKRIERVEGFYPIWIDKSALSECQPKPKTIVDGFDAIREIYSQMHEKVGANKGLSFVQGVLAEAKERAMREGAIRGRP